MWEGWDVVVRPGHTRIVIDLIFWCRKVTCLKVSQQAITCNQTTSGGSEVFLWSLIYSTTTEPWAQDRIPSARIVGPRLALQYSIIACERRVIYQTRGAAS